MDKYYKTPKQSATGLKFKEIHKRAKSCHQASVEFIEKYGFESYRQSRISYMGGISSCCKPKNELDEKAWKLSGYGSNEFMPKLNNAEGRKIKAEIDALPIVDIDELNRIVGYSGNGFKSSNIGCDFNSKDFYLFVVCSDWNAKIPKDCIEITGSEYELLSKNND